MVRMIMHGCNGRMGQMITGIVDRDDEIRIVAGVDINDKQLNDYPVFKSINDVNVEADVVVDFGATAAIDNLLLWCKNTKTPCVVCTTGLSEEQIANVSKTAESVAMLRSANMSLGINTLIKLLKEAANVFAPAGFDVEVVEKHHKMKLDAPSGTAIALADAVNEARNNEYTYVYDRSGRRQVRDEKEIGISAVRGGTIVGEHDVIFAGEDEVITFSHTAYSRAVFAKGAIQAAKLLYNKEPGLYTMADVVK